LGVGATSPSSKVHVVGSVRSSNAGNSVYSSLATDGVYAAGTDLYLLAPSTKSIIFYSNNTESARIDSSGNLLVGKTTAGTLASGGRGLIEVNGSSDSAITLNAGGTTYGYLYTSASEFRVANITSNPILFYTNNTERARITSGGVLCVGTTSTQSADCISLRSSTITSSNVGLLAINSGKSGDDADCLLSIVKYSNTNTTSQVFVKFGIDQYNSGSGQINANGGGQAAFGAFSDRRLKENIVDLPSQWSNIKALRPVEFDYIASEGGGHQISFVAQEFEEIYPDAVGERSDGMKTLTGWGKTEARLIKALQEAMTRIEELEAKVAALESN
jgi:hypothetical protein